MKSRRPLGLYIHIPFCRCKCSYCDFYSLPDAAHRREAYAAALCAHLTETAPRARGYMVDTVYFGGGTPTCLPPEALCRILKCVRRRFRTDRGWEVTLEANPESAQDPRALRTLRRRGFNRISIGMQSAVEEELRLLGRVHTLEQVRRSVAAAREAGFENLSLDLMYGLPGQGPVSWSRTLLEAVALQPAHISCYGLKLEAGTPLEKSGLPLPGDERQAEMYLQAVEALARAGYEQYEISNFARPGYASRHNMKYWTLQEYAGFGPGAHSDFGGKRYAFARDLEAYIAAAAVPHGVFAYEEDTALSPQERDTEWLMLGLRTVRGLDPRDYETRFRRRFEPIFGELLRRCAAVDYARREADGSWHLTPRGFLVSNQIIRQLLELQAEAKRRRAEAAARGDFRVLMD